MIPAGSAHKFKYEKNMYGGITRETYLGQLSFRVYFAPEKINRYTAIGLKTRSIEVDPKEVSY